MWVCMMGVANQKGGRGHKISRTLTRANHKELPFLDSWIRPCIGSAVNIVMFRGVNVDIGLAQGRALFKHKVSILDLHNSNGHWV